MTESTNHEAYRRGLKDGEVHALTEAVGRAHLRLDGHESRISSQERITYAIIGGLLLIQVYPAVKAFLL